MREVLTISVLAICSISTNVRAGPEAAVISALHDLKTATANKLKVDTESCQHVAQRFCKNALIDTVQLNNIESEIALRTLQKKMRSGEAKNMVRELIDKLREVNDAIEEVDDKLDGDNDE